MCLRAICGVVLFATAAYSQGSGLRHYVAPSYPPFARQMGISGQVTAKLEVDAHGGVKVISMRGGESQPVSWLHNSAREAIEAWKFRAGASGREITAFIYYSFSGQTRECYPRTTVTTDFDDVSVRVFVITDASPLSVPSTDPPKREEGHASRRIPVRPEASSGK